MVAIRQPDCSSWRKFCHHAARHIANIVTLANIVPTRRLSRSHAHAPDRQS